MKKMLMLTLLFSSTACFANEEKMIITKAQEQKAVQAPSERFTGKAFVTYLYRAQKETKGSGAYARFEAKARSNWHTHPNGQTIVVTEGIGRVQEWGGKVKIIKKGDVIWTPPGVKHWHGATADQEMTHFAVSEQEPNMQVQWHESVTDEVYNSISKD